MFLDYKNYNYLVEIKNNFNIIKDEFENAHRSEEIRKILYNSDDNVDYYTVFWARDNGFHPEQVGYDIREGDYSTLAIYKKDFPIRTVNIEQYFPKTIELINKYVPNVHLISFFRMATHAKLLEHTHNRKHLIFHMMLKDLVNGSCELVCGNETLHLKNKGDTALFDYTIPHSAYNNCESERINLVVDFDPFS
jgi:hypothetical protein